MNDLILFAERSLRIPWGIFYCHARSISVVKQEEELESLLAFL